ncbi:MAG: Multidrug resistance protein MdtG [Candidatus Woesearchaeota archaeon]|nr:Multidrug resistance protein MdtG [Candidatus Woesearchaeota archaeon]
MKYTKHKIIIFLILVTEVLGFSLVLPYLPFFAQELGASPFFVGIILAVFSICQFVSAPFMGRLSDYFGRRPMLIISQFSTFVSFIVLAFSGTYWMILLSRVIDGLVGSNFTIAQAYLSDISSEKNRSKIFGISGVAFGVGFLFGPAIGGWLSGFGYMYPALAAAAISLVTIILTYLLLPETVKSRKDLEFDFKIFHFQDYIKYFKKPGITQVLMQAFTYFMAHVIWVSSSAMYAERQLGFTAVDMGWLLAYVGGISIVLRGIFLGILIDKIGERMLHYASVTLMLVGLLSTPFISSTIMYYGFITLFAVGTGLSRPLFNGKISRLVSKKEQGTIMGVASSLASISQIIGPLIGGLLINYSFPGSVGIAASVFVSTGLILMIRETSIDLDV